MSSLDAALEAGAGQGAAPQPLTIKELAAQSDLGELLIRRSLGVVIDLIMLFVILLVPDYLLGNERYRATLWVWTGVQVLYFLVAEGLCGRTVGKLATGTVIVDSTGNAPGLLKAAVRTVLRIVEVNPLLLCLPAFVACAVSTRRQRLGDMLARTYVVNARDLRTRTLNKQPAGPTETIAQQSTPFPILVRRAVGAQIDVLVAVMLLLAATSIVREERTIAVESQWALLIGLAAVVAYFVVAEGVWGRTLGKLIMGTVVVDRRGRPPGIPKAVVRTLLRLIEVNPFLLGGFPAGIALLLTRRHQRLGDVLAGTFVVKAKDLGGMQPFSGGGE